MFIVIDIAYKSKSKAILLAIAKGFSLLRVPLARKIYDAIEKY